MEGQSGISISVIAMALMGIAILTLIIVIWSIRRHRNPKLSINCDEPIGDLMPSLSGLSQSTVYGGNSVELFENGAFFDMLFDEMRKAHHTVHFETYLWKEGVLGSRLVDALVERGKAGVTVRVLVDGSGGKYMGDEAQQRLKASGCHFRFHHPPSWKNIGVYNDRDHRKLVVIDGRTGFVGGHCIVDTWLGDADELKSVRDVSARIRGPVVHALQAVFAENWLENSGELIVGKEAFPELEPAGDADIHVASVKPEGSPPAVKVLHHLIACVARKRIYIQNPYFLPEPEAIDALGKAVARGVDVRVMVPSARSSDMPIVQHAAHRNFERLLKLGVRLFEYERCLLHQKVVTVDGIWSAIGSANFDDRSFETNDEITIGVRSETLAAELEAIFAHDCRYAVELELAQWRSRGLLHRARDHALYAFNEMM